MEISLSIRKVAYVKISLMRWDYSPSIALDDREERGLKKITHIPSLNTKWLHVCRGMHTTV